MQYENINKIKHLSNTPRNINNTMECRDVSGTSYQNRKQNKRCLNHCAPPFDHLHWPNSASFLSQHDVVSLPEYPPSIVLILSALQNERPLGEMCGSLRGGGESLCGNGNEILGHDQYSESLLGGICVQYYPFCSFIQCCLHPKRKEIVMNKNWSKKK